MTTLDGKHGKLFKRTRYTEKLTTRDSQLEIVTFRHTNNSFSEEA